MLKVIILGFNNPTVISQTFDRFYALTDLEGLNFELIFVDACYPIPDREANKKAYKELCIRHKATYFPLLRNFGQDGNFNKIFFQPWINETDNILFFDPDNYPIQPDYLKVAIKLQMETKAGYITLHRHHPAFDMRTTQKELRVSQSSIKYRELNCSGGWPMALWSGDFITAMRPLEQTHSYYGGTEMNIWTALKRSGRLGLMLEDYEDKMISINNDKEYVIWKAIVINSTQHMDFEEWLDHYRLKDLLAPVAGM